MEDNEGHHTIIMTVTAKRYDEPNGPWRYQLNDSKGNSYSNGTWVLQDRLELAT